MIVVDASVALKWILPEADSDKARALHSETLFAPAIWLAEVANALWRYVRLSQFSEAEAAVRLGQALSVGVTIAPIELDIARALALSIEIDRPVYDCLYLALAIREGGRVITADSGFASVVRRHGTWSAYLQSLSER